MRPRDVSVRIDGRTYSGSYHLDDGVLRLTSAYGSGRAPASGRPEFQAAQLLRQAVETHNAQPRPRE